MKADETHLAATVQSKNDLFAAFLSYSRKNDSAADVLMAALEERHFRIARDIHDLRGGEEWRRRLKRLIEQSQNVIFLISEESLASKYCSWELDYAVSLNKRLIPVLVGRAAPKDLPESLSVIHWIDARADLGEAAAALEASLRMDQTWTEIHTELGLRAQAWESNDGGLLRGRELKRIQLAVDQYAGNQPDPTGRQMGFLSASRKGARRRAATLSFSICVALVALSIFGGLAWIKQQENRLLALKGQGDSALGELERGDLATAVASLAYVSRQGEGDNLFEYAEVARFGAARLRPMNEVVTKMSIGDVLAWRGERYLKTAEASWQKLPPQPYSLALTEGCEQAVLVDATGITVRDLPSFKELLRLSGNERLIPGPIYSLRGGRRFLATGHYVVAGDEDHERFEPTKLAIIGQVPLGFLPRKPEEGEERLPFESNMIRGEEGTLMLSHETGDRFSVSRAIDDPVSKRFVIEGRERGYDDNPDMLWKWEIDLTTGKTVESSRDSDSGDHIEISDPIPTRRQHRFPSEISEVEFWRLLETKNDLPEELLKLDVPCDAGEREYEDGLAKLDFGEWGNEPAADTGESQIGHWRGNVIGAAPYKWGIHHDEDGYCYFWGLEVSGNVTSQLRVVKADADATVEWCKEVSFIVTESRQIYSPDKRWMAVASDDGTDEPLRLLDMTKVDLVPPPKWPSVAVQGMAFDADSKLFTVLSINQEMFIYSLDEKNSPTLLHHLVVGADRDAEGANGGGEETSGFPLQFSKDVIVGVDMHGRLFGVSAGSGEMLWSRDLPPIATTEKGSREAGLWSAPQASYVLLRWDDRFVLHHAITGTPLTLPINPAELLGKEIADGAEEEGSFSNAVVLLGQSGDFGIINGDTILLRQSPRDERIFGETAQLEALTGISAENGRIPLEKLPLK